MNALRAATNFYQARKSWLGDGLHAVPNVQAQQRADTCVKCPKNQRMPIWEMLTKTIARIVWRQIELKNQMKLAVHDEDLLHTCSACLCILPLKIHVPLRHILETTDTEELNKENPICWILSESEGTTTP